MNRIVTGQQAGGRDTIVRDDQPGPIAGMPGSSNETRLYWSTSDADALPWDGRDPVAGGSMALPGSGETLFLSLTFPPHARSPLHATPTTDYVVVISGELWLVMADGGERRLGPGDVVIQTGALHAWQNRSESPCTIVATMVGSAPRK